MGGKATTKRGQRVIQSGRDLSRSLVQCAAQSRFAKRSEEVPQSVILLVWKTSKAGDRTTSLGSLLQCWPAGMRKLHRPINLPVSLLVHAVNV